MRSLEFLPTLPALVLATACALSPCPAHAGNIPGDDVAPPQAPHSVFKDDVGFGKDPFFPRSSRRPKVVVKTVGVEPPKPVVPDFIALKGISFVKDKKLAIINNYTLAEGEEFTLKGGAKPVQVKCVEIKEKSVVIDVGGASKELHLRSDF
jgi:hypothetical protein